MWIKDNIYNTLSSEKQSAEQRLTRFIEKANARLPLYNTLYDMALAHTIIYQSLCCDEAIKSKEAFLEKLKDLEKIPDAADARNPHTFSGAWNAKLHQLLKRFGEK